MTRPEPVFLLLALGLGLFLRLDNLSHWQRHPDRYFQAGAPLLLSVDGYHYLDLARSLHAGTYEHLDARRVAPEGRPRPWPPSLLVMLLAGMAALGVPLIWAGVLVPALLGGLLALPVYALARRFAPPLVAGLGALVASLSPFYLTRTSLGALDTDCGVVTLAVGCSWAALRLVEHRRPRDLALCLALGLLGLLWWDYGRLPALMAALLPLCAALWCLSWRRAAVGLAGGGLLLVAGLGTDLLAYVGGVASEGLPVASSNVTEQRGAQGLEVAIRTAGSPLAFGVALAGLAALGWRRPQLLAVCLFPLVVAAGSFEAVRFLAFAAPLVGLGVAQAVALADRHSPLLAFVVALAALLSLPLTQDNLRPPSRWPYHAEAMMALRTVTPPDAIIWTDWGHGYPIHWWADRATLADGAYHDGKRMVMLARPLATSDSWEATSWIREHTQGRPTYLLLDAQKIRTPWLLYGSGGRPVTREMLDRSVGARLWRGERLPGFVPVLVRENYRLFRVST